ncbi:MAG: hypothetical protein BTN85_0329 [Candidatus Methanohalarchaeum thermophilum]|uniref:Uncharacterized protein n=1 Tax=Methanohalarchaeum thermophilum TaxID=1903181 RepID=A0A1Q6DU26_METT1|nr:MAG: hypothetical protein BTN85_0329 [Candidatus Methanohalarchaeum thermophilum]
MVEMGYKNEKHENEINLDDGLGVDLDIDFIEELPSKDPNDSRNKKDIPKFIESAWKEALDEAKKRKEKEDFPDNLGGD